MLCSTTSIYALEQLAEAIDYATMPQPDIEVEGLQSGATATISTVRNSFAPSDSNILCVYDIKAVSGRKSGGTVQPKNEVTVTILNANIRNNQSVYVLHVLEDANAISKSQKKIEISDSAYVSSSVFKKAVSAAKSATGKSGVIYAEIIDADDGLIVSGKNITFKTNSFSIFIIGENDIITVNLYESTASGATPVETVDVKYSDTIDTTGEYERLIYEPGITATTAANALFRGWTTNTAYTVADAENALTIQGVRDAVKAAFNDANHGSELNFYAMLYKRYTVTFYDELHVTCFGVDYALQRYDSYTNGESLNFRINVPYTPYTEAASFLGWKLEQGSYNNFIGVYTQLGSSESPTATMTPALTGDAAKQYIYNNPVWVRITGDIDLYAYAPGGHWLVFDENGKGATYVAPQFVEDNDNTVDPEEYPDSDIVMQRFGYTFGGWYDTKAHADAHAENPSDTTGKFTFGETLTANTTIYASWIPNATANYTVIIWKQNVSGTGYDFGESITRVGSVGQYISTVTTTGTGDGAYAIVDGTNKRYTGFHYDHMDSNVEIVPEGTSILNVYYDRNVVTLTFQIQNSNNNAYEATLDTTGDLYGYVNGQYVPIFTNDGGTTWYTIAGANYVETEELVDPLYALVNGNYVLLTKTGDTWYYTDEADYAANTVGSPKYGFINGRYVQLTERGGHYYYISGTETQYVVTTSTTGTQYALISGEYVQVFYYDPWIGSSYWYYYTYSVSTSNGYGAGTRYALVDGKYVQLRSEWRGQRYRYYLPNSNQEYTGTRYERNETQYNGTRYLRQEVDVESEYTGTVYTHSIPYEGPYYKLEAAVYTGERFKLKTSSSGYLTIHQLQGLYGSTLVSNGYTWPTDYRWNDQNDGRGTTTTFLDAFILPDGGSSKTFYGFSHQTGATIRWYKQNADGSWPALNNPTNSVTSSGGTFYITDKYNGYKASAYSTNGTAWTSLGEKDGNGRYATVSNGSYTNLYIRFVPLQYDILFMDGQYVDGNNNPVQGYSSRGELHLIEGVDYDSNLSSYNKGGANYYTPDDYAGFVFEGWYIDDACTHPYTFTTMTEGITVYAKWRQVQYRVFLHPNAGSASDGTKDWSLDWGSASQVMNFRVSNGGTISIPTGRRDMYYFLGWYTDPNFSSNSYFYGGTRINDNTRGLSTYDKTTDLTDKMDKWGDLSGDPENGHNEPWNSDLVGNDGGDRFWITQKLDLYAKWSSKLIGAKGIYLEYDAVAGEGHFANNSTLYRDGLLYADNSDTYAIAATYPDDSSMHFSSWQPMVWVYSETETGHGHWAEAGDVRYPGEKFAVTIQGSGVKVERRAKGSTSESDWEVIASIPTSEGDYEYRYTVRLKAKYLPAVPDKTHLTYDANGGTFTSTAPTDFTAGTVSEGGTTYNTITKEINVNSVFHVQPGTIVEREGYEFKGWSLTRNGEVFLTGEETGNYGADNLDIDAANDKSNTLYAVWEIARYNLTVTKAYVGTLAPQYASIYTDTYQFTVNYTVSYKDGYTADPNVDAKSTNGAKVSVSAPLVIENIPYGSTVQVTEVLTDAESQVFAASTVAPVGPMTADAAVQITNTSGTGTLTVTKTVVSDYPADYADGKTYSFTYSVNGVSNDAYKFDIVMTGADSKTASTTIGEFPIGTKIVLTEDTPANMAVSGDVGNEITISANSNSASVTNIRANAPLTVTKNVVSSYAPDKNKTYKFSYNTDYGTSGTFEITMNGTDTASEEIGSFPVGSKVTVTETEGYDLNLTNDGPKEITIGAATNNVTITNTRPDVTLTIKKYVDGFASDVGKSFGFTVAITGGETKTATATSAAVGGTATGVSVTVPKGIDFTLTEDNAEYENGMTVWQIFDTKIDSGNYGNVAISTALNSDRVIEFTNRRKQIEIYVVKDVKESLDPADSNYRFKFTVNGISVKKGELEGIKAGETSDAVMVPIGSEVIVTETDMNGTYTTKWAIYGADESPVDENWSANIGTRYNTTTVVFTNTRDKVTLKITKTVDKPDLDNGKDFYFDVNINNTITTKTVKGGQTLTIDNIMYGSPITVTERTEDIFGDTGMTIGDLFNTESAKSIANLTSTQELTFSNTRRTGSLTVTKEVVSNYAPDYTNKAYSFDYYVNGTKIDSFTITPSSSTKKGTYTIENLLVGDEVKIVETGLDSNMTQDGPKEVTIVEGNGNAIKITNTRPTASLKVIKKVVSNYAPDYTNGTVFNFKYTIDGVDVAFAVTMTGSDEAYTLIENLPVGISVKVTETGLDSNMTQDGPKTFTITSTNANNVVTITNTRPDVTFHILKTVDNSVDNGKTFRFNVKGTGFTTESPYSVTAGDTTGTAVSVPKGVSVTVSEITSDKYPDLNSSYTVAQLFTTPAAQTATISGGENLTFENKRIPATLTVTKQVVSGYTPDLSATYSFTYTVNGNSDPGYKFDIDLSESSAYTISGLLVGDKVIVTEVNQDSNFTVTGSGTELVMAAGSNTHTIKNERPNVNFYIVKTVDNSVDNGKTFRFNVEGTGFTTESPYSVTAGDTTGTAVSVPKGVSVTVSEITDDKYPTTDSAYTVAQLFNTPAAQTKTITGDIEGVHESLTFANTRRTGIIKLTKSITSSYAPDKSKTYKFEYYLNGSTEKAGEFTISMEGSASKTVDIPGTFLVGDKVKIVEVEIDSNFEVTGNNEIVTVAEGNNTHTVTNTRPDVDLTVKKFVKNDIDVGKKFNFTATIAGGETKSVNDVVAVAEGGSTDGVTIKVPKGIDVTVTEVMTGTYESYNNVDYTYAQIFKPVDPQTVSMTESKTVSFTNERLTIDIHVKKDVEDSLDPDDKDYLFQFTVNGTTVKKGDQTGIKAGETSDAISVPVGTSITVIETDKNGTYVTTWAVYGASETQIEMNGGDETANIGPRYGKTTVIFTNTREKVTLKITKNVDRTADEGKNFRFNVSIAGTDTVETVQGGHTLTISTVMYGSSITVAEITDDLFDNTGKTVGYLFKTDEAKSIAKLITTGELIFNNIRRTGTITVTKNLVSNYAPDKNETFSFQYFLNGSASPTGSFNISMNGGNTAKYTIPVTFLVGDTVKIVETVPAYFDVTGNNAVITVEEDTADSNNTVKITNTRPVVDFYIKKTVDKYADENETFKFGVTLDGVTTYYDVKPSNATGIKVTVPKGVTVTIAEKTDEVFFTNILGTSYTVADLFETPAKKTVTITESEDFTFANKRRIGKLTVEKAVVSEYAADYASGKKYVFGWKLNGSLNRNFAITMSGATTESITLSNEFFIGEVIDITESDLNDPTIVTTYSPSDHIIVIAEGSNKLTVTNTRVTGDLTITKNVADANSSSTTKSGASNEKFIFRIEKLTAQNGSVDTTFNPIYVTMTANKTVTVKNLKAGWYTVIEVTDWSWRYNCADPDSSVHVTGGQAAAVEFTNSLNNKNWLHGENSIDNTFTETVASEDNTK